MTTYSISLDEVDLALLPLRTHKYNDFLKQEHFQFQVMKAEEEDESEPTIFYKCHICAINVPAAFSREHAASVKHRANARIANVAAERTRALISALPPPVVAQTARFCANCAITVGKNHEKTKEHRVAVMHDKLLWELMNAYVGDDCDSGEDFSDTDDFVVKEDSRHYNGFATWSEVSYNKEEKQKKGTKLDLLSIETNKKVINKKEDNEAEKHNKYNKPVDSTSEVTNIGTSKYESANSSQLTNVETNKYQSNKSSELTHIVNALNKSAGTDNNITDIIAKTDAKPSTSKATEMNSSSDTGRETNQIATNNDQDTAISTPSTSKAVPEKIEYVEFVNKVNKTVKVYSDYFHSFTRRGDIINCKICSTSFNNEEVGSHIFSLKHLNKMPSYMIDEHCVRKIDDVFSHCIVCNQMVKHTNLAKHYLTINHSQREKQLIIDKPNSVATTSKTANIPKLDVRIDKPAFLEAIVNTAEMNQSDTAEVKVKTPEVKVKTPEVKMNAQNEVRPIDWPVIYPYEMTKQGVLCVICNCNVPNNPENRKEHLVGLVHVRNVKKKRVCSCEDTELDVNCCVKCDSKVPISFDPVTNLNEWSHANKEISTTATGSVHSLPITRKPFKLEYPYEATKQPSIARCLICDMNVTISTDNLKGHLDGLNHVTNELDKKLTVKKAFASTKKASVARCKICDIKVPNTLRNLLDHLFGSSHIKKEKDIREIQQNRASPVPRPVQMTQSASEVTTFESASDTIGRKSHMYFSWI